jgi:hypothetical protein
MVNQLARGLKTRHEPRTMDQLRPDVFLDLLDGRHLAGRRGRDRGVVDLRVDLTTLIGMSENGAEVGGYGPIVADIARQITDQQHSSEWRWTVTDPRTAWQCRVHRQGSHPSKQTEQDRRSAQAGCSVDCGMMCDWGAEIVCEPADQFWGARDVAVRDPSGNLVRIAQA